MSAWDLPESVAVGGKEYAIRSDFRAVLDIMAVLGDPELSDQERGAIACEIFYPDFDDMPAADYTEACERLRWFVSGGDGPARAPKRKLVDWEQDFGLIIAPVNRVLGYEARSCQHLHWWTFLAAYCEVGDCTFAQVVAIRKKKQKGKRLEKHEEAFYRENRSLVDFRVKETSADKEFFDAWI